MTDKDWIMIKVLAEEKNITKAAERLYLSQPAITYRLKALEKEVGSQLVTRTPSGILLTPEGEVFLHYAEEMLLTLVKTKEKMQSMRDTVQGTLRLGASSVFSHYELPYILKGFVTSYPKVDISLKTGLSHRINRLLQHDEIAVAVLRGDYHWTEEKMMLFEEPICIVSAKPIDLNTLADQTRITYNTDTPLQTLIESWWRETYAKPFASTMEVDSMDTCRELVKQGLGWAILPAIGLHAMEGIYTHLLGWSDGQPFTRRTWLLCRHAALELPAVRAFCDYIRHYYATQKLHPPVS